MDIRRWNGNISSIKTKKVLRGVINMEAVLIRPNVNTSTKKTYNIAKVVKLKNNNIDSYEQMIIAGENFKKCLGLSDKDVYSLLKR